MRDDSSIQIISRLTPLNAILALIESNIPPVTPQKCLVASAKGRTLAEDVFSGSLPPRAIALRDGFAVEAAATAGAEPYMPVQFPSVPSGVNAGEPLPSGTDAVLPFDAVVFRGNTAAAIASIPVGEGVLPAGGDVAPQMPLRRAGERVRDLDAAVFTAAGINDITILLPRIAIALGGARSSPLIDATLAVLGHAVAKAGGLVSGNSIGLDAVLAEQKADAVLAVGGTGSGQHDRAVATLARRGRLAAHGIAITPGETTAFGFAGTTPVLLVPGRLDAAVAAWFLIGRYLLARLAGSKAATAATPLLLTRKVTSTIGMTEFIPVEISSGMAEPLASGYLSFTALARSDGWIVVPAESEGFAAGTQVAVNPWF